MGYLSWTGLQVQPPPARPIPVPKRRHEFLDIWRDRGYCTGGTSPFWGRSGSDFVPLASMARDNRLDCRGSDVRVFPLVHLLCEDAPRGFVHGDVDPPRNDRLHRVHSPSSTRLVLHILCGAFFRVCHEGKHVYHLFSPRHLHDIVGDLGTWDCSDAQDCPGRRGGGTDWRFSFGSRRYLQEGTL